MWEKGFLPIFGIVMIVIAVSAIGGGIVYTTKLRDSARPSPQAVHPSPSVQPSGEAIVCTQDAQQCPDGSYVGRSGPNCEFAACPNGSTPNASVNTIELPQTSERICRGPWWRCPDGSLAKPTGPNCVTPTCKPAATTSGFTGFEQTCDPDSPSLTKCPGDYYCARRKVGEAGVCKKSMPD